MRLQRIHEAGVSMAWTAVLIAVVGLPLMTLTVDITRLLAARARLATAVDAGCEAMANSLDVAAFSAEGAVQLSPEALSNVSAAFYGSAPNGASFSGGPTSAAGGELNFRCEGAASLQPLLPLSPPLSLRMTTFARARFATSP